MKTNSHKADMIYCLLVGIARSKGAAITYEELGHLTGIYHRNLGISLEMVARYCEKNNLPALTSLVVSKATGVPSDGSAQFGAKSHIAIFHLQRAVHAFNWETFQEVRKHKQAA